MCISDNICLNLVHGSSNTRIYYENKEFTTMTVNKTDIIPFIHHRVKETAYNLEKMLLMDSYAITILVLYPNNTSKKKIRKINETVEYLRDKDLTREVLTRYLSLLL